MSIECIVRTLYMITKYAGDMLLILLCVALSRVLLACWQLWREGFKISIYNKWDSQWPIVISKRYFQSLFGKFNLYSLIWFTIPMTRCLGFLWIESVKTSKARLANMLMFWSFKDNSLLIFLLQHCFNSTLTFIVVLTYCKRITQIFVTEYINRNWRIMIFKFIDITAIDWNFQSLPIEGLWYFSKFSINTFREFSTGFIARVMAHLKHSSSSFLRLTIAFFGPRNAGSGI